MMKGIWVFAFVFIQFCGFSQSITGFRDYVYKKTDTISLKLYVIKPANLLVDRRYPTIVFFFGGGWSSGKITQFEPHARYFASRGMVAVLADYRVKSRHNTTPFDAVSDAKSVIRYLRQNAAGLNIDTARIVASGGSAGGHLAAATATISGLNDVRDNLKISCKPNALVLFNPVFDNGPDGYGYDRIGARYTEISPMHNIRKGTPPTIVFLGTADDLIPVRTANLYKQKMEEAGCRCDLYLSDGQKHGFFNYREDSKDGNHNFIETVSKTDIFLASLGYIKGKPAIKDLVSNGINKISSGENSFRDSIVKQVIAIEKERVINRADKLLNEKPRTVTASSCPRSLGGRHDFYSEGPYWWPDPANPNGPFIRHDGLRYPGLFNDHDRDLRNFSWIVGTHTSAWLVTGNEKYVRAAMDHLKAWLTDTTTLMNPNMLYAQAIRGINSGRGTGIIDAGQLMDVAQSILILEKSPYVSAEDIVKMKGWFREFITWLTTHKYGIDEMNARNNHGSWWHAQIASYARLAGDEKVLKLCRDRFLNILLPNQMASNGSYPEELARTKPYSYSLFNLDATAALLWILDERTSELWNYNLPDGRGFRKGLDFMKPFLVDKSKWPGNKDVDHWDAQPEARQFMLFAAITEKNTGWFDLWKKLSEKNSGDESRISMMLKNPLIWLNIK